MSPIREQGTYMFPSAITYFQPHVYFRDNKNLFGKREIMHEKQGLREKLGNCRRKSSDEGERTSRNFRARPFLPQKSGAEPIPGFGEKAGGALEKAPGETIVCGRWSGVPGRQAEEGEKGGSAPEEAAERP